MPTKKERDATRRKPKKIDNQGWEEYGREYYAMVVRDTSNGPCVDILDRVNGMREIDGAIHHREKIEHVDTIYEGDLLGRPELMALLQTVAVGAYRLERLLLPLDAKRQGKNRVK